MHSSFATRLNLDLLEQNYERWQKDSDSVDSGWSAFFEGFELGNLDGKNGAVVEAAPAEARNFSTFKTPAFAIGCGTGSNRASSPGRPRRKYKWRFSAHCSKRKRSKFFCTPVMSDKNVFRSKARRV